MKNWRLKVILLTVCCVIIAVAVKYLPSILHSDEVSEVYLRYKDRDDLRVGFVKDYRIDDSTVVDVTTLTAKDSASWESLLREMKNKEESIRDLMNSVRNGEKVVKEYYCLKNNPDKRIGIKECSDFDLVIYSYNAYIVYIFDVKTLEQGRKVQAHKNKELLK